MNPRRITRDRTPNIADRESISLFNKSSPSDVLGARGRVSQTGASNNPLSRLNAGSNGAIKVENNRFGGLASEPSLQSRKSRRRLGGRSIGGRFGKLRGRANHEFIEKGRRDNPSETSTIGNGINERTNTWSKTKPTEGRGVSTGTNERANPWSRTSQEKRSHPDNTNYEGKSGWSKTSRVPTDIRGKTNQEKINVRSKSPLGSDNSQGSISRQGKQKARRADTQEKKISDRSPIDSSRRYLSKRNFLRFLLVFVLGSILTNSVILTFPLSIAAFAVPTLLARRKYERTKLELVTSWPEILDLMISGLHSGLSIAETIHGLADRGPEATRALFTECRTELVTTGDLDKVLKLIKEHFHDAMADQVCEVLDFARSTGSRDTTLTLRTLGEYIRSEISLREEIRVKHGWIRNSAAVASVAPWILLGVLSLQPNTIRAYSSGAGVLVLLMGVGMCSMAFLWMNKVGRMPEIPRVFE